MKTTLTLLLMTVALMLTGCDEHRNGPTLTEPAEIYETCFVPAGHGIGTGVGNTIGAGGEIGVAVTTQFVDIPATYAVVFKCQHGKFVIDGDRGERLYRTFSRGDRVTVRYCERWRIHEDDTHDILGLRFIDAIPEGAAATAVSAEVEGGRR